MTTIDNFEEFMKDIVGVVEATDFERHMLWLSYAKEAVEFGHGFHENSKFPWVQNTVGRMVIVGWVGDHRPIWISLSTDVVNGQKLLFWHATSPIVDYDKCDQWLKENLPPSAFRDDGFINRSDPSNFTNIFP